MEIIKDLFKLADKDYQKFNQNIVKGDSPIIGIRIPILRNIAKDIIKNNKIDKFFKEYKGVYFEEKLIKGLIIASGEKIFEEYINEYLKELDSWCLVDTFCNSTKFIDKNKDKFWDFIKKLVYKDKEFIIRTGYVMMLNYYLEDKYIDEVTNFCLISSECYYVNMAIAWLLCEAYIKYPEKIMVILNNKYLNNFVRSKAIDKINDSYRVGVDDKRRLRDLK